MEKYRLVQTFLPTGVHIESPVRTPIESEGPVAGIMVSVNQTDVFVVTQHVSWFLS